MHEIALRLKKPKKQHDAEKSKCDEDHVTSFGSAMARENVSSIIACPEPGMR